MPIYRFTRKYAGWLAIVRKYDLGEIGFACIASVVSVVLLVGFLLSPQPIFTRGIVYTDLARYYGARWYGEEIAQAVCGAILLAGGVLGFVARKQGWWTVRTKVMAFQGITWAVFFWTFIRNSGDNPTTYIYLAFIIFSIWTWLLMHSEGKDGATL